jgi:hypothetical protein
MYSYIYIWYMYIFIDVIMFATISGDMQWCHDLQGRSRVSSSASANTSRKSSNTSRRCRPAERRSICERVVRIWGVWGPDAPPVHWNLILTLGFGCHRKPSFGRGFGTWRCWQMLCACGGHWAPYWAHRAPSWRLAACWAHVGASVGTSCYMLGPQWRHVGRSSPNPTYLHPILAAPDRSTHCAILFVYATDALAISSLLTHRNHPPILPHLVEKCLLLLSAASSG